MRKISSQKEEKERKNKVYIYIYIYIKAMGKIVLYIELSSIDRVTRKTTILKPDMSCPGESVTL